MPEPWDKPNGTCSHCGAPLNAYLVGGYKLHDGHYAVAAASNMTRSQIEAAIKISEENIQALRGRLERMAA
jgi:hypothetical protein